MVIRSWAQADPQFAFLSFSVPDGSSHLEYLTPPSLHLCLKLPGDSTNDLPCSGTRWICCGSADTALPRLLLPFT